MKGASILWKLFAAYNIVNTLFLLYAHFAGEGAAGQIAVTDVVGYLFIPFVLVVVVAYAFDVRPARPPRWLSLFANVYAGYAALSVTLLALRSWSLLSGHIAAVIPALMVLVAMAVSAFLEWLAMQRYSRGETVARR